MSASLSVVCSAGTSGSQHKLAPQHLHTENASTLVCRLPTVRDLRWRKCHSARRLVLPGTNPMPLPREMDIRLQARCGLSSQDRAQAQKPPAVSRELNLLSTAGHVCVLLALGLAVQGLGCRSLLARACQVSAPGAAQVAHTADVKRPENVPKADVTSASSGGADVASREGSLTPRPITVPLNVVALRGSVPVIWMKEFLASQGKQAKLSVSFRASLDEICSSMMKAKSAGAPNRAVKKEKNPAMAADVVSLSDTTLPRAVAEGLITPIQYKDVDEWIRALGPRWERLLRLDRFGHPDPAGKVWAVPYRWGYTVMAYRKDKLAQVRVKPPADWSDLFDPRLTGRVAMANSTREAVGAAVKSLGGSYNARDFEREVPGGREAVRQRFLQLRKQVRLFDSEQHMKALMAGDVWVVVGWSADILPAARRLPNVAVTAPASGTSLWADLWVIPATASFDIPGVGGRERGPSPLVAQWLSFCLQPARSLAFEHHIMSGASPFTLKGPLDYPRDQQGTEPHKEEPTPGVLPFGAMAKSEFLEPLGDDGEREYRWLMAAVEHEDAKVSKGFGAALLDRFMPMKV